MAVAAAALLVGAAGRAATPGRSIGGDPAGVALLTKVVDAYKAVPAVELEVGPLKLHGTLILRAGTIVAEELASGLPAGRTIFVERLGVPTLERAAGKSCWDENPGVTDSTMGFPFPTASHTTAAKPTRAGHNLELELATKDRDGVRSSAQLVIDPRTDLVLSIREHSGARLIVEQVAPLAHRPSLPATRPRC